MSGWTWQHNNGNVGIGTTSPTFTLQQEVLEKRWVIGLVVGQHHELIVLQSWLGRKKLATNQWLPVKQTGYQDWVRRRFRRVVPQGITEPCDKNVILRGRREMNTIFRNGYKNRALRISRRTMNTEQTSSRLWEPMDSVPDARGQRCIRSELRQQRWEERLGWMNNPRPLLQHAALRDKRRVPRGRLVSAYPIGEQRTTVLWQKESMVRVWHRLQMVAVSESNTTETVGNTGLITGNTGDAVESNPRSWETMNWGQGKLPAQSPFL